MDKQLDKLTFQTENIKNDYHNIIYKEDINNLLNQTNHTEQYSMEPIAKPMMRKQNNHSYYRNPQISIIALKRANYKCEINEAHPTFMRKNKTTPYTEAHHLIPISKQNMFEYSLDVPANIVSLCSHCHNEIHYGDKAEELVEKIYYKRQSELKQAGINIDLKELLRVY